MKGIILAAGKGTRLYPASITISKTLLPIYDKPMIYYSLSTLMNAGIRDILIVVSKDNISYFKKLLGNGEQFGISLEYAIQKDPKGIADALLVGENFINGDMVTLMLGDNLFYGDELNEYIAQSLGESSGATIFCKRVDDPCNFGVVEINNDGKVVSLEEKPANPKSNLAVTGLYIYDSHACEYAKSLKPSTRGELEITDLNKIYYEEGNLKAKILDESIIWADTGTFDSMLDTSNLIKKIESTKRTIVGCPEIVALSKGFVTKKQLIKWTSEYGSNLYYDYIKSVINTKS